jgi:hypothetical protein
MVKRFPENDNEDYDVPLFILSCSQKVFLNNSRYAQHNSFATKALSHKDLIKKF